MQEKGRDNIDRPVCVSVYSSQNEYNVYISLFQMMREMRTPGQPCGLKVRLGNIKTGTLKCALKIASS